jgi:hypothetical protein
MRKIYQKPQIKVVNISNEAVMIATSAEQSSGAKRGDEVINDIGAKRSVFDDFSSFPSSSTTPTSSDK